MNNYIDFEAKCSTQFYTASPKKRMCWSNATKKQSTREAAAGERRSA